MKAFFALLTLSVAYLFGAAIGFQTGFNPTHSGLVALGLFAISKVPSGVARSGPDVASVVAQLGQYITVNKKQIWAKIRQGIELHQYMTGVPNVTGFYAEMSATTTELHQAFQKGLQFKGNPSIEAFKNQNYHVKIDALLDELDKLWDGYLVHLTDETTERKNWPFVQFIIETALIPKMIEEINDMSCRASYVAPTPGVAGPYMESMTGLFTLTTNLVTAGALTPIVVGAMNTTNGVSKVEAFLDAIPEVYKKKGGQIFTSVGKRKAYTRNYRDIYNTSGLKEDRSQVFVDDENKIQVIGLTGAGAANRMIFVPGNPKEKLIHMYNKIAVPDRLEVQATGRDLILLHDRWDGVGYKNLDGIFVSDVA